jgi:hypothetical protein
MPEKCRRFANLSHVPDIFGDVPPSRLLATASFEL